MFYLVGLQNKGEDYQNTRHNAGAMLLKAVVDAERLPNTIKSAKYMGEVSEGVIENQELIALFPDTFMNQSGGAVKKLVPQNEVNNLVLFYDDVDVAIGEFKVSFGKNSGGHNGVESVIDQLGTKDFVRLRVGIAPRSQDGEAVRPSGDKLDKYVLGKFTNRELEVLENLKPEIIEALKCVLKEGYEAAMNKYN